MARTRKTPAAPAAAPEALTESVSEIVTDADTAALGPTALVLPSELTIYSVGELHPLWMAWLAEAAAPGAEGVAEVVADGVDQVDAAGVQLLLSLQRALSAIGRRHRIRGASRALAAGCIGLGLGAWLDAQTDEARA